MMAKLNPPKKKRRQRPLVSDVNEPQHHKGKLEKRKTERDAMELGKVRRYREGDQDNKPQVVDIFGFHATTRTKSRQLSICYD